ncbi:protein of unknown function [Tepidibacter aestuarii]|nr:protein of unknown function [Tepidibacter aestuarii]
MVCTLREAVFVKVKRNIIAAAKIIKNIWRESLWQKIEDQDLNYVEDLESIYMGIRKL